MKKMMAAALAMGMVLALGACSSKEEAPAAAADSAKQAVSAASAGNSAAASLSLVEEGKLHMATNASFPPYEMTTDDGGFEGIDVEIATKIAEKMGLELVVDNMDFSSVITAVSGGKSDIAMAGLTVTDERKKSIDFTDTYAKGVQSIIVKEDSEIQSADDLAKASAIGTQEGTTGYIYCSDTEENGGYGDKTIAYADGTTAVQALLGGKVDAVVIDNEPAKQYVAANKGLKLLDTSYVEEEYAIGVSKENTALKAEADRILQELKEDGTVQKIIDSYIAAK